MDKPTRLSSFHWRTVWILTALYVVGNLLSIPLLVEHGLPIPSLQMMVLFTTLAAVMVAVGQYLSNAVGLAAPLIEGQYDGPQLFGHSRKVLKTAVLFGLVAAPVLIVYNRHLTLGNAHRPDLWRLILASIDAGIQEELFGRYCLMSLFVWFGMRVRGLRGQIPTATVYWLAILLSAGLFAWNHVDNHLSMLSGARVQEVLLVTGALGIGFGWCFWRFGIECAILAHIMVDAIGFAVVDAVYF